MTTIDKVSFLVPSISAYAKAAVATIGIQNNTCGFLSHALQVSGV